MNIFHLILRNFSSQPRSLEPETPVDCPAGYRGELAHDASLCVLCGACVYVCSPGALRLEQGQGQGSWTYDAGRCCYCGRCVEYCRMSALSFIESPVRLVRKRQEERVEHRVPYQHCTRCGAEILPLPAEALARLLHTEKGAVVSPDDHPLCERCRQRAYSQLLKAGLGGGGD